MKKDTLSRQDKDLWQKATKNITRLDNDRIARPQVRRGYFRDNRFESQDHMILPQRAATEKTVGLSDVDSSWLKKLRRGTAKPEGRIDLHGMTEQRAYSSLVRYIEGANKHSLRVILVITGKGGAKTGMGEMSAGAYEKTRGVLQQNVPRWLNQNPLAPYILSYQYANDKDGGQGALYVVLRRARRS